MVKKLLKYEFYSFAKSIFPMELILLGIAVFTRFIQIFEKTGRTYKVIYVSSVTALIISMIVCLVMTFALNLIRFYKNLYSAEGYLTLALPATHTQHIFAKLISAVLSSIFSAISVLVAAAISTAGMVFNEFSKATIYLIKQAVKYVGWQFWLYFAEAIILVVLAVATSYLLFYGCITLGQTAKKNRILAAFGVYFAYYMICQILGTVFLVSSAVLYKVFKIETLIHAFVSHPYAGLHICFAIALVVILALFCLYFFVTRTVMKKKLNLE